MTHTREVLSQNSCYTYVMEDEETARASVSVSVFEVMVSSLLTAQLSNNTGQNLLQHYQPILGCN